MNDHFIIIDVFIFIANRKYQFSAVCITKSSVIEFEEVEGDESIFAERARSLTCPRGILPK
jgi:hypothetical protein